jgi:hypothetical protein
MHLYALQPTRQALKSPAATQHINQTVRKTLNQKVFAPSMQQRSFYAKPSATQSLQKKTAPSWSSQKQWCPSLGGEQKRYYSFFSQWFKNEDQKINETYQSINYIFRHTTLQVQDIDRIPSAYLNVAVPFYNQKTQSYVPSNKTILKKIIRATTGSVTKHYGSYDKYSRKDQKALVGRLLDKGADPNFSPQVTPDSYGYSDHYIKTPLALALEACNVGALEALIDLRRVKVLDDLYKKVAIIPADFLAQIRKSYEVEKKSGHTQATISSLETILHILEESPVRKLQEYVREQEGKGASQAEKQAAFHAFLKPSIKPKYNTNIEFCRYVMVCYTISQHVLKGENYGKNYKKQYSNSKHSATR